MEKLKWKFFSSGDCPAHQRLVVLDQTHDPGGFLVIRQIIGHRRQDGIKVPLGHRVVSPQQRLGWRVEGEWLVESLCQR